MIFAIATAITNLFGIDFAAAQKWARRLMLIVIALVIILPAAIIYTRCTREKPISPEKIAKAQKVIAEGDRKAMTETLAEIKADEAAADKSVMEAEVTRINAIAAEKKRVEGLTNEQLAAELEALAK